MLRSKSDHPFIVEHRDVVHKIGVTREVVKSRVANARKDPTYLLADVEISSHLSSWQTSIELRSEPLLHKFFAGARLDLQLKDRFGAEVEPREWFLVPLAVIDEAIQRIKDATIGGFRYDTDSARIVPA